MIHEEICTYVVAKLAKENGFSWHTRHIYDEETKELIECKFVANHNSEDGIISAPTQSLIQRWLREERGVIVEVFVDDDSNMPLTYNIHQYKDWNWECVCHHHGNYYAVNDWEQALEDGLKYALENLV